MKITLKTLFLNWTRMEENTSQNESSKNSSNLKGKDLDLFKYIRGLLDEV